MVNLIAISGKSRHGKDTLADLITKRICKKKLDYWSHYIYSRAEKIAFADPIKKAVNEMFPHLSYSDLWGPSENRSRPINGYTNPATGNILTIRDVLLDIGKMGRRYNPNCWIDATMFTAKQMLVEGCFVVISDMRFKNEKKAVEDFGGKVIRIIRPDVEAVVKDESEIDLDDVHLRDYDKAVINYSIKSLEEAAEEITDEYFGIKSGV